MSVAIDTGAPIPSVSHGDGSLLWTTDGQSLVDLASGFGAVFLGHGHAGIAAALKSQCERLWVGGRYRSPIQDQALVALAETLPSGLKPLGLNSTGMEAIEFAMRIAANLTGRNQFVGFSRSMHGKSALSAALCWKNALVGSDRARVLPFVADQSEAEILAQVSESLSDGQVAALLVEPMQGSNGNFEASAQFYEQLIVLCRRYGSLCIFDEILTGLYRTGPCFYIETLRETPDLLLFAKSMGNGFPAAAVAGLDYIEVNSAALPGSTFSGNPLASAAILATLRQMRALPMRLLVESIETTVRESLAPLIEHGVLLRGRGALWTLELPAGVNMNQLTHALLASGVVVSGYGRFIRLLPAATIEKSMLAQACNRIASLCVTAVSSGGGA